jgi:hypothetical protein
LIVAAKKVVRVQEPAGGEPTWKPTPEAKRSATTRRIVALLLWAVAIGIEAVAGVWLWQHREKLDKSFDTTTIVLLLAAIVAIAAFAIIGSLLWKRANVLDPASRSEPVRFFVQNQLGAFIAIIAFVPLIVLILTNKNMASQQKAIVGGAAVVALIVAGLAGTTFNSPSTEQYTTEINVVQQLTGGDQVYWTSQGHVYHLCSAASDVNRVSSDDTISQGSVAAAHAAGMERITLEITQELHQCGFAVPSPLPAGLPAGAK